MKKYRTTKLLSMVCIMFFALPYLANANNNVGHSGTGLYFIEPGPIQSSRLYADGSIIELKTESVTWPIIGSDVANLSLDEFKVLVHSGMTAFANNPNKLVVNSNKSGRGLNLVFNISSPPPGATAALESAEVYLEGLFSDPVTVTIDIAFSPMGQGTLGWCQSYYAGAATWTNTRNGLIVGMDTDDSIQNWLPTGSTIPVRYEYGNPDTTYEDLCYFTKANYNATIGTLGGTSAHIEFNSDYYWDYDPSNGMTAGYICFLSVATHEVGHCLGFTSGADARYSDIEALDIFRFQNTDDGNDYNPDNLSEFQTTARMVDKDNGTTLDDVNSDLITREYRMSDGNPYQCSHFSQDNVFANMQPAIGSGETFYPNFYRLADREMFDAIGWDCLLFYTLEVVPLGGGDVTKSPDTSQYQPGTSIALTAIPDPGWTFDHWSGNLTGNSNPDTIILDGDKIINAHFTSDYCTLTVDVSGNGSVAKNPDSIAYPRDTPVELTALPDVDWIFSFWSGNLWGSHNPDTIIMNTDKSVTAHFIEAQYVEENQSKEIAAPFLSIYPNPARDRIDIRWQLVANNSVDLAIYDINGRQIKKFNQSALPTSCQLTWDGKDNAGKSLPSGIYFMRLQADELTLTKPLLLIR